MTGSKPKPPAPKNEAAKLREKAKDKSLPQDVRNQMLDDANKREYDAYEKTKKYAKGGGVKKRGKRSC